MLKTTLFLICLAVFGSPVFAQDKAPEIYQVPEAYEIYGTILPQQWPVQEAHAKKLIIQAETVTFDMCLKPEGESVATVGPAIANYLEVNKKSWLLQKTIPMDQPYDFVFTKELDAIFSDGVGGWKNFYQRYPDSGGYHEVSAVGFNPAKTVAVVYVAHACGGLCGGGDFEVLQKKDRKWVPLKWAGSSCSWVS